MQIFLYIILALSLIALTYLFIVAFRGGNKNSKSFQKELAERNAKNKSKKLAKDFVEGNITFEQLKETIYNPNTLSRVATYQEKVEKLEVSISEDRERYNLTCQEILQIQLQANETKTKLKELSEDKTSAVYKKAIEKWEKIEEQMKKAKEEASLLSKNIRSNQSLLKQIKYDLKQIISNYSYGAITGTSSTKLTRSEKVEEKAAIKAAMKEKKAQWKVEDAEYYATVKANIATLKVEVANSKIELEKLQKEYEADKENEEKENAYREYRTKHERLLQKYRIEKDRVSFIRRVERWSKRGSHLRREIFVKRQYYYLVAPYTILFFLFTVIPVLMSLYFSFTYFNLLEAPRFVGWENYMRLFVDDKVFVIAIRNTAILAVITGPLSYLMAFLFAWLINELRPLARSIMTLIFYAPSISGNVYLVWKLIFSSDIYGYANAFLIKYNIIKEPITWLQDAKYIIWILIIVQLWLSLGVSFLAFIAGLQSVNRELYEAGAIDGIKNRWQELWFITLPQMKSQLLFGAVMQITSSLAVAEVSTQIAGFPSIEYAGHTIITHLMDYGSVRMEMGYASAIATILFIIMIVANLVVRKVIRRVGS